MKIEILYPELCNLFGEYGNVLYLKKCLKNASFIETHINDKPCFVNKNVDLIYLGACQEKDQEKIIKKLLSYKNELIQYIKDNKIIIATGNSLEIFLEYIEDNDKKISGLGIFEGYAKRNMNHRHNSLFLGKFNDIKIVGNKSQFSFAYNTINPFISVTRGVGINENIPYEGIKVNNFYGTYLLGPFLVANPYFTKYILKLLKVNNKLPFEKESIEAYEFRLNELEDPNTSVESKH